MVAGLDEKSRRMMAEAESRSRDRDLTELERELEASFVADLGTDHEEIKTAVLGPESAPTVQMPRASTQDATSATSRFKSPEFPTSRNPTAATWIPPRSCAASTATASIWIWTGSPTPWGPATPSSSRARKMKYSRPRFSRPVSATVASTLMWAKRLTARRAHQQDAARSPRPRQLVPARSSTQELALPEMEPVTMSEVGTKLDLARAYMDMGDPEGARSILEEVVQRRFCQPETGSAAPDRDSARLSP